MSSGVRPRKVGISCNEKVTPLLKFVGGKPVGAHKEDDKPPAGGRVSTRSQTSSNTLQFKNDDSISSADEFSNPRAPSIASSCLGPRVSRPVKRETKVVDDDGFEDIDDYGTPMKPMGAETKDKLFAGNGACKEETARVLKDKPSKGNITDDDDEFESIDNFNSPVKKETTAARPRFNTPAERELYDKKTDMMLKKKVPADIRSLQATGFQNDEAYNKMVRGAFVKNRRKNQRTFGAKSATRRKDIFTLDLTDSPQAENPKQPDREKEKSIKPSDPQKQPDAPKLFINPLTKYGLLPRQPTPDPPKPESAKFINPFEKEGNIRRNDIPSNPEFKKRKTAHYGTQKCRDAQEISSPPVIDLSQSESPPSGDSQNMPSSGEVRVVDEMSYNLKSADICDKPRNDEFCRLCEEPLPKGYLDAWRDEHGDLRRIKMAKWTEICQGHHRTSLEKVWEENGYPSINWKTIKKRVDAQEGYLIKVIENQVHSPFRDIFAKQLKESRGNVGNLLRRDCQLQYPGYYGPRGSELMLNAIMKKLGTRVGDSATTDKLISGGGVAAFVQTVLVPEVAVRLIMSDMDVDENKARKIMEESRGIGETLHLDYDSEDIEADNEGGWVDVDDLGKSSAVKRTQRNKAAKAAERLSLDYSGDDSSLTD